MYFVQSFIANRSKIIGNYFLKKQQLINVFFFFTVLLFHLPITMKNINSNKGI